MFHVASEAEIREGKVTDVYFVRTLEILRAKKLDRRVKAEFIAKSLPRGAAWAVLAGLEETAQIFEGLKVSVRAMPEGAVFRPYEPVMEIEGPYLELGIFETALLGLICQASGIATKAARCKKLAGDRRIISFGARRMHPVLAPMVERNAFVGGCDGVAVIKSAELIGEEAVGTVPHALILLMGDTVTAMKAFDEVVSPSVRRVALIDTFNDEKFEALRVAEALGGHLYGVRFDTPASRRGDFVKLIEETRWELALRGFKDVKIFVSGGIDEEQIPKLNPVVDAYGIGTAISAAPVIDFAMDIVEIEGLPIAKRGKMSGSKQVYRCPRCFADTILPVSQKASPCPSCGVELDPLLLPFFEAGKAQLELPKATQIRGRVLTQLGKVEL